MNRDVQRPRRAVMLGTCRAATLSRRRALAGLLALPWALGAGLACAQTEVKGLDKIRARGVLKVAVYKDNAPFSDGPGADLTGLDITLARALAHQLQLKLMLLPFDAGENMNDDLRNMVWKGHYLGYGPADVMMHVPADPALMQQNRQVLILAPYMRQVQVLLHDTQALPKVRGPTDLLGFKLAVERGTGSASVLMGHNGGMLRAQVGLYNTGLQAARAVLQGQAAAAYVMRSQAESALLGTASTPARWAMTPMPLHGVPQQGWPLGMAVKADAQELGKALEQALQTLRGNGQLQAIFQEHGVTLTEP